jgi:hypothetical protein
MLSSIGSAATRPNARPHAPPAPRLAIDLPKRPDLTVLNRSIPLFYIGRNSRGFWVAREADGRSGGVFLFRQSALRFTRNSSASSGCGVMILNGRLELDLENRGSRVVEPLTAAMDFAARRLPGLVALLGIAVRQWRKLVAKISQASAAGRRNRDALERELFHGQYRLSSKNDDDLPVP